MGEVSRKGGCGGIGLKIGTETPTAAKSNVKLKASIARARTVKKASRPARAGVQSPRAPARKAKAWPAMAEAKRAGNSRRAIHERASRGPSKAVPRTAESSATGRVAAPRRPLGVLTAPVSATTSK